MPTGEGRTLLQLPIAYDVETDRWFPSAANFLRPPYDETQKQAYGIGTWNRDCINCHATGGEPQWSSDERADSRAAELGIACDSCHGGGAAHIARQRNPVRRYLQHLGLGGSSQTVVPSMITDWLSQPDAG